LRIAFGAVHRGDLERARTLATAAYDADPPLALGVLAQVAFARGDALEGARIAHEAADAAAAIGFPWWQGVTLLGAAEEQLRLGEPKGAKQDLLEALSSLESVRDLINLPIALAVASALAAQHGDVSRSGTLWGALEAEDARTPRTTTTQCLATYEPYLRPVRGDAFEKARAHGRTLTLDDAVSYALSEQT
jgi:hypothetical protein